MSKAIKNLAPMDEAAKAELTRWLKENDDLLPDVVKDMFSHYNAICEALSGSKRHLNDTVLQLRRALGIIASSEKQKSGDPIGAMSRPGEAKPKDKRERLLLSIERSQRLADWHRQMAKKHRRTKKDDELKLSNLDDIIFTPEEEAELKKEHEEAMARTTLGSGEDPALESPKEAFMQGGNVEQDEVTLESNVNPDSLDGLKVLNRFTEERGRFDFEVVMTKVNVHVEKVVVSDEESGSTKVITASTRDIGPPNMDVTWNFVTNVMILVAQYAMPFNRLGSLLTTPDKSFTSAKLSRMFAYVARRFLPIYLHNFYKLANAPIFTGDDTTTRVIEFNRFQKLAQTSTKEANAPPWESYATKDRALESLRTEASPSLGMLLAGELGFEFYRKNGSETKNSLQTTVISGRSDGQDPRSLIVFYRSHIGGFGNLLSMLLTRRDPEWKDLIIQSDLSTVNLVSDIELASRFNIKLAGCTSHARRPFSIYREDDPDVCAPMLHYFQGLYLNERLLDLRGRNLENVTAVRDVDSRQLWEDIKDTAEIACKKWSRESKLGKAARYILRHFPTLTAYLDNPYLSISNDFSERMLRMEKLIQANALFRNSLEGRFALDINRSVLQTAIAAHAPLHEYVPFVLKASPEEVEANPEAFTALSYMKNHHRQDLQI